MNKNLRIVLKVDAKTGQITKVSNSFSKLDRNVQKTRSKLAGFKNDILKFGGAAIGIYAVKRAFDSIQSDFKVLENASLEVAKTTGLTGDSLKTLTDRLDEMSVTMNGFEIVGLYDIAAAAGQLGIEGVEDIANFTKEMQYMASSSKLTAEEAAEGFAKLANTLNLPISEINKLTGSFSGLAATTTATEKDLLNFTQRLAGAGKNLGLTNAEIVGIGASLQDVGVNFETGGTAISKTFLKMLTDGEKFAKVSGVSFEEYSKTLKDEPIKAVNDLLASLGKMDKTSKVNALKYLGLDSAQAANTLLKLSGNIGNLNKNIATSNVEYAKGNATLNEYLISSTSLEQAQMKNANASMLFGRTIGSFLKPVMLGLNDVSTTVFNHITKMIGEEATGATGVFGKALVDMANSSIQALGTLVGWITTVASGFRIAVAGYNKLRGAIGMQLYGTQQENEAKMKSLQLDKKLAQQRGHGVTLINADIRALKEKMKLSKEYTDIRKDGDKSLDEIAAFQTKVDGLSTKIKSLKIDYKKVVPSKVVVDATNDTEDLVEKLKEGTNSFNDLGDAAGKSGSKASKALKDITLERRGLADDLVKESERFAGSFANAFDEMIHGDLLSSFQNLFDTVGGTMMKPFVDSMSTSLSSSLSSMMGGPGSFASFGVGAALSIGTSLLSGLFSSTEEAPITEDFHDMSDSITNSLERLYDVEYPMLELTRDMKGYLSIIASSFGNIENSLLRSGIDFGGKKYQPTVDDGSLWWGADVHSLESTNIKFDSSTVGDLMAGQLTAWQTDVIKTVEDGIFWDDVYYDPYTQDISSLIAPDLAEATQNIFTSINDMGQLIGADTSLLSGMSINIGEFDTTDMDADEITKEIEQRFGAEIDAITASIFSGLSQYQLGGEGMFETAARVVVNMEQVTHSLGLLGVALEETAAWATIHIYDLTEAMIKGAGGIDNLNTGINSYMENFFSEQEQYEMQIKNMGTSFASLELALPKTNEEFRALAEGIDKNTVEGAALFGELMTLADGFSAMTDAGKALEEENKRIAEEASRGLLDFKSSVMDTFRNLSAVSAPEMLKNMDYYVNRQDYTGATSAYNSFIDDQRRSTGSREDFLIAVGNVANKIQQTELKNPYQKMEENQEEMITELKTLNRENKELRAEIASLKRYNIEAAKRA